MRETRLLGRSKVGYAYSDANLAQCKPKPRKKKEKSKKKQHTVLHETWWREEGRVARVALVRSILCAPAQNICLVA
jgi:hypothetical protein